MDCTVERPEEKYYPSYFYFSSLAYQEDVPQNYYVGRDSPYAFEHGWKAVANIDPGTWSSKIVSLQNLRQPSHLSRESNSIRRYTSLTISFSARDPDNDLAGYQVFISDHSRGWDYNQFYGGESARFFWADPSGWKPDMYEHLFELPPSNLGSVQLTADETQVNLPIKRGSTYFISVMAFDTYGLSVGRVLFPESNELRVAVP